MPRTCTVCTNPDRAAIDKALVVDKISFRDIARQWRVSKDAIARHKEHIPQTLAKAQEAKEVAHADSLLDALASKDPRTAIQAIRTAAEVLVSPDEL
jgi:hypothetical protein